MQTTHFLPGMNPYLQARWPDAHTRLIAYIGDALGERLPSDLAVIAEESISIDMLLPLMKPLHDDHCKRDKANNRDLHYDQYCLLILFYLFNPTVSSLRAHDYLIPIDLKKSLLNWMSKPMKSDVIKIKAVPHKTLHWLMELWLKRYLPADNRKMIA